MGYPCAETVEKCPPKNTSSCNSGEMAATQSMHDQETRRIWAGGRIWWLILKMIRNMDLGLGRCWWLIPRRIRDMGWERGPHWWFIPERIRSMGYRWELEVHLEIQSHFWKGMQEAEWIVLHRMIAWKTGFGILLITSDPSSVTDQLGLLRQFA